MTAHMGAPIYYFKGFTLLSPYCLDPVVLGQLERCGNSCKALFVCCWSKKEHYSGICWMFVPYLSDLWGIKKKKRIKGIV